jgi:hypothetical protein
MAQALAQACESLKQDCIATAQAGLLMAQVKPASAQVWKRNGHLVRSDLAIVHTAMCQIERSKAAQFYEGEKLRKLRE